MDLGKFFRPPRDVRFTVDFVEKFLVDQSARDFLEQPQFSEMLQMARDGASWTEIGQKYADITGPGLPDKAIIGALVSRLYGPK